MYFLKAILVQSLDIISTYIGYHNGSEGLKTQINGKDGIEELKILDPKDGDEFVINNVAKTNNNKNVDIRCKIKRVGKSIGKISLERMSH